MVKLMFCLVRKPDVDEAAFHRYWLEEHAPLVRCRGRDLLISAEVQPTFALVLIIGAGDARKKDPVTPHDRR